MEIVVWLIAQAGVCLFVFWLVRRARRKDMGQSPSRAPRKEEGRELMRLREERARSLSVPLTELSRPARMCDIIGQENGIRALRAALCGANPQHVIIYGPPGIGKTCAARLVLEEARKNPISPFDERSAFVEVDATCVRFDERAIADPLIGSVHDPIYQGAGALGSQGVPQPKPGAVTRAHCGMLFLDEIGELHPIQMNKLLKVLEDRRVYFESAYYSPDNANIPGHIHDIFANGLPADFRLVGATTRDPSELPPALRSRCVELFFRPLSHEELMQVAKGAAMRAGIITGSETLSLLADHCGSGRDAVNMVQLAAGCAADEGRVSMDEKDVLWVAQTCNYQRRPRSEHMPEPRAGVAAGLGVTQGMGIVIEIECSALPAVEKGRGRLDISGAAVTEEIDMRGRKLSRKGTARASLDNVLSAFYRCFAFDCRDMDILINVPGGMPLDGPSAGIAMAAALMSAISGKHIETGVAFTGELTATGQVRPVGGVREKLMAAAAAGATVAVIPEANWDEGLEGIPLRIIPARDIVDVMRTAFRVGAEGVVQLTRSHSAPATADSPVVASELPLSRE